MIVSMFDGKNNLILQYLKLISVRVFFPQTTYFGYLLLELRFNTYKVEIIFDVLWRMRAK